MSHSPTSASSPFTASAGHRGAWKWLAAAISACALIVPATAKADSILSLDFDVNSGYYNFGYAFGFYGDAGFGYHGVNVAQESGLFPGIGVGDSNALRTTADSSGIPAQLPPDRTYEGWAFVIVEDAGQLLELATKVHHEVDLRADASRVQPDVAEISTGRAVRELVRLEEGHRKPAPGQVVRGCGPDDPATDHENVVVERLVDFHQKNLTSCQTPIAHSRT
jgi:hypothetical protein